MFVCHYDSLSMSTYREDKLHISQNIQFSISLFTKHKHVEGFYTQHAIQITYLLTYL